MKTWGTALLLAVTCLLTASSVSARTWYIKPDGTGDVPTIQAGVDSASHGDTLLCASGTYSWSNQGTGTDHGMIYILRGSADMVIKSESGPDVTILNGQNQGRIVFFQGETELTIEGFTFTRGEAPNLGSFTGGAFAAHLSSPVIRDCIFKFNHAQNGGGAYWYGGVGAPELHDCHFEGNSSINGGAVYLINSPGDALVSNCTFVDNEATGGGGAMWMHNFRVTVESCLFDGNIAPMGGAWHMQSSWPSFISNSTVVGNQAPTGAGINVLGGTPLTMTDVIVALCGGGGSGVNIDGTSTGLASCTDIWGNSGGDWVGSLAAQLGTNGNISADPRFCPGPTNFFLQGDSPCAPGNHPDNAACGVIGLLPVACGSVAVEQKTWGEIKSMYQGE